MKEIKGGDTIHIRKIDDGDIDDIVDLWYEASIDAHNFIPDEYWRANRKQMKEKYLPGSETYLSCQGDRILGFVSMVGDHLAAFFVRPQMQGRGIGTGLLDRVKDSRDVIRLKVYVKNTKAIEFYKRRGFKTLSGSMDNQTGEEELILQWNKNGRPTTCGRASLKSNAH